MFNCVNLHSEVEISNFILNVSHFRCICVEVEIIYNEELINFRLTKKTPIVLTFVFIQNEPVTTVGVSIFVQWYVLEPLFIFTVRIIIIG